METNVLKAKQQIKSALSCKRGTVAVGAIAIILMFSMAISCITIIVLEYNSYSKSVAYTTQTDAMKAKENLLIQSSHSSENVAVTAINEGSTPSMIVAVLTLNTVNQSIDYQNLDQPITCTVLGQRTFNVNQQSQEDRKIGVLTSLGNMFWETQLQHAPNPTPTPTPPTQPWLTGWEYRKSHTINPAAGAGTDYQIKVTVNYGSGTDNAATVYLNGHGRDDFADIRFTTSDATTQLSYWMENFVESNYAVFWVKVTDNLSINPATIYMYYGNPTATTTSNGQATFIMFQDIVSNIQTQFGTIPLTTYGNTIDPGDGFAPNSPVEGIYASPCMWFRYYGGKQFQATSTYLYFYGYIEGGNHGSGGVDIRLRNNPAPTGWQTSNSYGADTNLDRKHIIVLDYSTVGGAILNFYSTWRSDSDDFSTGTVVASHGVSSATRITQEFTYSGTISHINLGYASVGQSLTLYHEYYAIAKYVNNEPAHGTWGSATQK